MMVANHFDVRWVDGYSAVSDVPSSLAAVIEKLAAELPSSHDRIELAVRDVRRSDGTTSWVGLLRFVVVVSSVPRPLGFLHAAVLPSGHCLDLEAWRTVISRRYGAHPEERIRTLYEELAESTKDIGRDRLHALAIRLEDVRDLLVQCDDDERPPSLPRTYTRPGSRPPKGLAKAATPPPAPAAAPPKRPSSSMLPSSVRVVDLPEPPPETRDTEELPGQGDEDALPNDVTQPMEAPSGTAAPLSGEHPQHRAVARPPRARWLAGGAVGALALLLGALGWLAHRHVVLIEDHDRLAADMSRRYPDHGACERDRAELDRLKRELEERRAADKACDVKIEAVTRELRESLNDARSALRFASDKVSSLEEVVRLKTTELQQANSNFSKLKSDLTAASASKDRAEQLHREEQAQTKQLRASLSQQHELLRELCGRLQSAPAGSKPPKECQGIK
jgi:hypothetical protein